MKYKTARLHVIAAASLLMILLMSTGAYVYATQGHSQNLANIPGLDSSENTSTTTESGNNNAQQEENLEFQIVPVLVQNAPADYKYGRGEVNIDISGTTLSVEVQIESANPDTRYTIVLSVNGTEHTLATSTTDSEGHARVRSSHITLDPGVYQLGLLILDQSTFATGTLVLQSDPSSLEVTLSESTETTSETSTTTSAAQTSSEEDGGQDEHELKFRLVSTGPQNPGKGEVNIDIRGLVLDIRVEIEKANATAEYSVMLSVNGTEHVIGTFVTNEEGDGQLRTEFKMLSTGTYEIGVAVTVGGTVALESDPSVLTALLTQESEAESETESETRTTTETTESEHELKFTILPAEVENAPQGYSFGRGEANIEIRGTVLDVEVEIDRANPNTQYSVVLSANGTHHEIGSLVTNHEGESEIRAQLRLETGVYQVGVLIFDTSTFSASTLVMKSDPASLQVTLTQNVQSESESETRGAHTITIVKTDEDDENEIDKAIDAKTIPAVVQVNSSAATASVIDQRFSVSVGKHGENGLIISISATNVTGPKVLLINLTENSLLNLSSGSLIVTLDENRIEQASSVTQVLNPLPIDPARYIIVGTSSGLQLLISIPHFSLHTIRLLPVPLTPNLGFFPINGVTLIVAIIALTAVFAAIYASRKRIYSLIA